MKSTTRQSTRGRMVVSTPATTRPANLLFIGNPLGRFGKKDFPMRTSRRVKSYTRTNETALNLASEVGTTINGQGERSEVHNADVEANRPGCSPVVGIDNPRLLPAYCAVHRELCLGMQRGCEEAEDETGKN